MKDRGGRRNPTEQRTRAILAMLLEKNIADINVKILEQQAQLRLPCHFDTQSRQ